ncbi:MAG: protein kinase [Proteobacteria bacterium]|nr:protein kinase [Pseudomonadota bacterium]
MADNEAGAGMPAAEVDFSALPVGAGIGRFVITSILGQGGFGITYRARDEQLGREVAIKEYLPVSLAIRQDGVTVLPRSTKAAEDFTWGRERFVAEGRTLASLNDAPAIVRVYDFLELNGTAYIVMELVRGETLEDRIKRQGKLSADEVNALLWPLLDGLEQVHKTGFLHRDIKPANILLREDGKPTLIDFGASRAAMAGRTTAMTAIFTPGYAAAEQMTAAKQGPWTDIYGLSATLYHAITGTAPPSAFDRMLDDEYAPLTRLAPAGFPPGLLIGLDAGLAVRAAERPQTIAGWRSILGQSEAAASDATVALGRGAAPAPAPAPAPSASRGTAPAAPPPAKSRTGLFAALGVAALMVLGGGGYLAMGERAAPRPVALQEAKVEDLEKALDARRKADAEAADKRRAEEDAQKQASADADAKRRADDELKQAEDQRQKAEAELARLREELEAQKKAAAEQRELADAQARRAAAEEARRKVEAEMAALKAAEDEARRKVAVEAEAKRLADEALAKAQAERAAADAAAQQKAEAEAKQKAEADAKTRAEAEARAADRKTAEAAETALRLSTADRQRLQVALTALGFNTGGSDGAFGPRTRQMIAGWQKGRNEPETGFVTAAQQQALLRDAAPAVAKFDDDQKKQEEEAKKKAEEDAKAKAAAAAAPPVPVPAPPAAAPPPAAAAVAPPASRGGINPFDGRWTGTAQFGGSGRNEALSVAIQNGTGSSGWRVGRCGAKSSSYTVNITNDGKWSVHFEGFNNDCVPQSNTFKGVLQGNMIQFRWSGGQNTFTLSK